MSSSEASGMTALERRRKSRKDRPKSHRAKARATSRHRMAVYRARKKAQETIHQLKLQLGAAERAAVEARSARKRHEILCDWFRSHRVKFDARILFTKEVVDSFISKAEMHQVELLVAEYEIDIMTGVGAGGDADDEGGVYDPAEKGAKAASTLAQSFGDGNHQAPSSTDRGDGRGRLTKGIATANSKRGVANALQGSQQQGGSIGTRGLAEANSTRAGAFGGGNYQAPSTTAREGDRGKLVKKCVSADSTSTQVFVSSIYQELLKDEIKHYLPSQIPGDGDHSPSRPPDSTRTQPFEPRLSDDQVNDFLSCFGGNLAEESAPTDSSSSNSQVFGEMPNNDEIDRFFANFQTVKGEAFPVMLPANEEEGTGSAQVSSDALEQKIASLEVVLETKVFGESNLLDTVPPSPTGAETIPSATSRSIFGEEGPGPACPSKIAGIYGEGTAPAGGDGGNVLLGRSVDSIGAGIHVEGAAPTANYSGNVILGSSVVSDDSAGICGEGVAPAGGGGDEVFPGSSVDSDSDGFDIESLGMNLGLVEDCVDSDLLQW